MKPISLEIEGFNSYTNKQIIDFSKLISYGFFGIFGPTGSGKTSIIDAITIALYGKMPRYENTKIREFINSNRNNMFISYKFELGEKVYVAKRSFKKKDDKTESDRAIFYEIIGDDVNVISEKINEMNNKVSEVMGINYDDFVRTIILPQGKFNEFLHLANKDRKDMLERIFNLQEYGDKLKNKINDSRKTKEVIVESIKQELEETKDVSKKLIVEYEENYNINILDIEKIEKEIPDLQTSLQSNLLNKDNLEELLVNKNILKELEIEKDNIYLKENELNNAKNADLLKNDIFKIKELNKNILYNKEKINNIESVLILKKTEENTTSEEYKEIFKNNKIEIPKIQKNIYNYKYAITIKDECKEIRSNINAITESKKKTEAEKSTVETNMKEIEDNIKKNALLLDNIISEKENSIVTAEFREFIQKLFEEHKEKEKSVLIKQKIEEKILINKNHNKSSNENFNNILISLKNEKDMLENNQNKTEENQKNHVDFNEIIKIKDKISEDKKEYEEKKEIFSDIKEINSKFNKIKLDEYILKIKNISDESIILKEKLEEYEKYKLDNIIFSLSKTLENGVPCPLCGSLEHKTIHKNDNNEFDESIEKNILEVENKIKINDEILMNFKVEYNSALNEKNSYEKLLNEKTILIKNIDIIEMQKNINHNIEKYNINLERHNKYLETEKIFDKEKEKLQNNIHSITIEKNKIESELDNYTNQLKEFENDKREAENNISDRTEKIDKLLIEIDIKEADIYKEYEKIKSKDKSLEELNINEKNYRKINSNLELEVQTNTNKTNSYIIEISEFSQQIIEKNSSIEDRKEKLNEMGIDINFKLDILLNEFQDSLNNLELREEELEKKLTLVREERENKDKEFVVTKKELEILINSEEKSSIELEENIKRYKFLDIKDVINSLLDIEKQKDIEEDITKYNESKVKANLNIERLEKITKERNIEEIINDIEKLKEKIKEQKIELDIKKETSILLKKQIEELKIKFEKRKIDLELYKKEEHKLDLLTDLNSLFKGNTFIEFISKKQLLYITKEASARIKDMTNGHYALELKDTEFVIRDDFDGGIRRNPKTLSGGETFIVSLCLALALSSKIQLSNKNPLELFFLDEGFGTLDRKSLDDVITCLENLKREKLSTGIISHSEELKNRVLGKLIVHPPKQFVHGSEIEIDI